MNELEQPLFEEGVPEELPEAELKNIKPKGNKKDPKPKLVPCETFERAVFLQSKGISLPQEDGTYRYSHYKTGESVSNPELVNQIAALELSSDIVRLT